jgi:hypothetical protein
VIVKPAMVVLTHGAGASGDAPEQGAKRAADTAVARTNATSGRRVTKENLPNAPVVTCPSDVRLVRAGPPTSRNRAPAAGAPPAVTVPVTRTAPFTLRATVVSLAGLRAVDRDSTAAAVSGSVPSDPYGTKSPSHMSEPGPGLVVPPSVKRTSYGFAPNTFPPCAGGPWRGEAQLELQGREGRLGPFGHVHVDRHGERLPGGGEVQQPHGVVLGAAGAGDRPRIGHVLRRVLDDERPGERNVGVPQVDSQNAGVDRADSRSGRLREVRGEACRSVEDDLRGRVVGLRQPQLDRGGRAGGGHHERRRVGGDRRAGQSERRGCECAEAEHACQLERDEHRDGSATLAAPSADCVA